MIFTTALNRDIPELKKLWKDIFQDDDGYIDLFFEYKMKPEYTFVAKEDGEIKGTVYSVYSPLICNGGRVVPALYMCGICTKPECRGRKIAGTLIENCINFAKEKNFDLCYLIPANLGLFEFYGKLGFEKFTYINKSEQDTAKGLPDDCETGFDEELLKHYANFVQPFKPQRSEKEFLYISKCYSEILRFPEGYMVLDEDGECVYLMEQTFDGTEYAKLYAGNKNKKLIVYEPTDCTGTPFSVAKKLNKDLNLPDFGYINLMLN